MRALVVLVAASLPFGCSRGEPPPSPAAVAAPSTSGGPGGTLLLGERISSPFVPLAEIASHPGQFQNRVVATTGTVTAVCQERGCWMEIHDASGEAHVRMHGHSFFVPKTSSGHVARVQATVLSGPAEECADSPPPSKTVARVELDATGVEVD